MIADGHFVVTVEADMKTAFRIDESDNPIYSKFHHQLPPDTWRIVSEDPRLTGFLRIVQSLAIVTPEQVALET